MCLIFPLTVIYSRYRHVVAWIYTSFFCMWLNNIPLNGYTTFCTLIPQHMDICVASTFSLLQIILLWAFMPKFLFVQKFSFLLRVYLEVKLLGHIYLPFWGISKLFSDNVPSYIPSIYNSSNFSAPSPTCVIVFFIISGECENGL